MSCDLHRHDEFSYYDGSGKAVELAKLAKEKGHTSLGLTNHGNTSGLVLHYDACKNEGIKPILGCEGYFLPKYKEQNRGYHLILIAKDVEGYKNLNIIQSEGDAIKYYNPIWTFEMLEKYNKGLICTTACVASYSSQMIIKGKKEIAIKYLQKMQQIFGEDLYVEIQPYSINEKGVQEKVNIELIKIAKKLGIKTILTSDSHRGRKEDIEAYITMHKIKNQNEEYLEHIRQTYSERYMPDVGEMEKRFMKMHKKDFKNPKKIADEMTKNMEELEEKVSGDIIDDLAKKPSLPIFDETQDSYELLKKKVIKGLKEKGLDKKKEYVERVKEELRVVKLNNFMDYFLIVQDYCLWAKNNDIMVGPGRGSGCNCLLNYLLNITDVDPIFFKLDFRRFIREGKASLPDIDLDFQTSKRGQVQEYILNKYKGRSCQIAAYGLYRFENLLNDLMKLYDGLKEEGEQKKKEFKQMFSKFALNYTKKSTGGYAVDDFKGFDSEGLLKLKEAQEINKQYPHFVETFCFLVEKVKYLGTHAAGVIISRGDIRQYTALRKDKTTGKHFACYNLLDLDRSGAVKFDILGLNSLDPIAEIRKKHKIKSFDYIKAIKDEKILEEFKKGNCNGIFQYGEPAVQNILKQIEADNFEEVVAASALNRPGPLSAGMPDKYVEYKNTWKLQEHKPIYKEFIEDTYGCILYQEQLMGISVKFAGFDWNEADLLRKMVDNGEKARKLEKKYRAEYYAKFMKNTQKNGIEKQEANDLFKSFSCYAFNKGHSVGYALISFEEMYNKVYYPNDFWYTKLKNTNLDKNGYKFMGEAVRDGAIVFLPHVNYSCDFSLRKVEGEDIIQIGMCSIKGVGKKAAQFIEDERKKNGIYRSYDEFVSRCKVKYSPVSKRVIEILVNQGCLDFDKKNYIKRVKKYNAGLYSRGMKY